MIAGEVHGGGAPLSSSISVFKYLGHMGSNEALKCKGFLATKQASSLYAIVGLIVIGRKCHISRDDCPETGDLPLMMLVT